MVAGGGRWPAAEGTGAEEEWRTWVCALRILCLSQGPSCNLGLYCALLCNIIPFRSQKKGSVNLLAKCTYEMLH